MTWISCRCRTALPRPRSNRADTQRSSLQYAGDVTVREEEDDDSASLSLVSSSRSEHSSRSQLNAISTMQASRPRNISIMHPVIADPNHPSDNDSLEAPDSGLSVDSLRG